MTRNGGSLGGRCPVCNGAEIRHRLCEAAATGGRVLSAHSSMGGLEREGILKAAAWAKRRLGASVCATRCRRSMQQVYWEVPEATGRWAVVVLQCTRWGTLPQGKKPAGKISIHPFRADFFPSLLCIGIVSFWATQAAAS